MSSQLKEKKEQPLKRDEKADFLFNQHIVRTVAYTAAGFGVGMLASLLFKHKAGMTLFFAGTGAGYGGANLINDLSVFRKNRSFNTPTQIQGQNTDQRRFERRDDDRSGNFQQAKENVKEGAEELSRYMSNKVSQAAKGIDETGRNLTEKAKREFSRGGDDSDDRKDNKSEKRSENKNERRDNKSEKREPEGKREDKSQLGQGKSGQDKNQTENIRGQTFQSFKSNPVQAGPKSETHEAKKDYQLNRNKANERDLDNQNRRVQGLAQERGDVDSISKAANIRIPNDPTNRTYDKKVDTMPAPVKNQVATGNQE